MVDAEFEWDDAKAERNWRKHGVSFSMARDSFRDAFAVEWIDQASDAAEMRCVMVAIAEDRLLAVVFVMRGERVRIISAR